MQNEQLVTSL